jgi:hypothetical protein
MFCDTATDKNVLTASGQVADVNIVTFQFLILNYQKDFFSLLVIAFSCLCLKWQKFDIYVIVPYIYLRKLVMRWAKVTPSPWRNREEYRCAPVSADSYPWSANAQKKLENQRNTRFISLKMPIKQEQAVTWWNPAAQSCPVVDSSSFAPVPMLPHGTCLHSASSVLAVCISCRVIALFVFRKPLFIN